MAKGKKKPEALKRFMWEFPDRKPEDRTATSRLIDRMKPPMEWNNGRNIIASTNTGGRSSLTGVHVLQDRSESQPVNPTEPRPNLETDGHH